MASLSIEGLILKQHEFGEADRVLVVLSDRLGKISVIARGVRKISSRRAGNVEVLNRVKMQLFKGKSYTLTEAESLQTFTNLKSSLVTSTSGFHVVELLARLLVDELPSIEIYRLSIEVLNLLNVAPRQIYLRAFEIKLLNMLGFWSLRRLEDVDPRIQDFLLILQNSNWQELQRVEFDPQIALAIEQILRYYIEDLLESKLKSASILREMR